MTKQIKTILKIVLPLLLGIGLVWYSLAQITFSELIRYFKNADYFWIGLGVLFGLFSHLSRAYRWKFMIEPLGYRLRLPNSIMAVFAAYLINYTIPRAGEITRASIITNYEKVPFEKAFGTIISERVADMLVMVGIIIFTLFLEFDFIYRFFSERFNLSTIIIGFSALIGIAILFFLFIKKSNSKLAIRIKTFVSGLLEGILVIFKMKQKWAFIFHTLFIWTMYVLMFYVTSFSLEETSNIPFAAIMIGFIAASFSIAATNGGIGAYPEAIVLAFLLFKLPEDPSRAFGWIMWTSQTVMLVVLGGLALAYLPVYNRWAAKKQ